MWRKWSTCVSVMKMWTVWRFPPKTKHENRAPCDVAVHSYLIYPWESKSLCWRDTCTPVLITAVLTVGEQWEQVVPPTDEWTKQMWSLYGVVLSSMIRWKCWEGGRSIQWRKSGTQWQLSHALTHMRKIKVDLMGVARMVVTRSSGELEDVETDWDFNPCTSLCH